MGTPTGTCSAPTACTNISSHIRQQARRDRAWGHSHSREGSEAAHSAAAAAEATSKCVTVDEQLLVLVIGIGDGGSDIVTGKCPDRVHRLLEAHREELHTTVLEVATQHNAARSPGASRYSRSPVSSMYTT
jgi:hypothetical protein